MISFQTKIFTSSQPLAKSVKCHRLDPLPKSKNLKLKRRKQEMMSKPNRKIFWTINQ